jgi:hypothetical protein
MNTGSADETLPVQRRWYENTQQLLYIVVEIKCDGGDVRNNSMRALAATAVAESGEKIASFSVNITAVEGKSVDQRTMELFRSHREAWHECTTNARHPSTAMTTFAAWVTGLNGQAALVAAPLAQTAVWLDAYLRRHTPYSVYHGPFMIKPLFYGPGIDLPSLVMGVTGRHYRNSNNFQLPVEWRGARNETHKVKEDVEMHADLLVNMLRLRAQLPKFE